MLTEQNWLITFVLISLSIACFTSSAFSEDESVNAPIAVNLIVKIRTVKALDHVTKEEAHGTRNIDGKLRDISGKLLKLPYRSFRLLSTQNVEVPLMRKDSVTIPDGHSLMIRPLSLKDKRVCMWIRWLDENGATLLDSRMHFNVGESVLAGADSSEEEGILLAIEAKPKE